MFDRIKISVKEEYVKELRHGALFNLRDGRKGPTSVPAFSYKREWGVLLIDISVPRTLFNNTLEEAIAEDKDKLVWAIQVYAKEQGLNISNWAILNADVWYLELGKNIILSDKRSIHNCLLKLGLCLAQYTNWIGKVRYYSNEGNTGYKVCLRNDSREFCFYDKTTKELVSKARDNEENKKIFGKLLTDGYKVLRYEVKFFNANTVKRELGFFHSGRTFNDIWNTKLIQEILTHFWKDIEDTLPSARSRKSGLIKSIQNAVQNGVSCNDVVSKIGFDYLEQQLGATTLKQLLISCRDKVKRKSREVSYGNLRIKRRDLKSKFKTKKEYVAQKISQYLQEIKPIHINKDTDEVEGVL